MDMFEKISKSIILCITLLLSFYSTELQASDSDSKWFELVTKHTIIRYKSIDSLERFHKSINYGSGWWSTTSSFAHFKAEENQKIASMKTDAIFERIQEILDMRKKIKKIIINLYPDKKELGKAYVGLYEQGCPFRAWYEYKTNTVNINVKDCHEGMLAHELAHGIIDNFLLIRPPRNTAEILARYVDLHLK